MGDVFEVATIKYNSMLPGSLRDALNRVDEVMVDHNRRGLYNSSFCIGKMIDVMSDSVSTILETSMQYDIDALHLHDQFITLDYKDAITDRISKRLEMLLGHFKRHLIHSVSITDRDPRTVAINHLYEEKINIIRKIQAKLRLAQIEDEALKKKDGAFSPLIIDLSAYEQYYGSEEVEVVRRSCEEINKGIINRTPRSVVFNSCAVIELTLLKVLKEKENALPAEYKNEPLHKWKLFKLIKCATALGIVSESLASLLNHLRDYRNYIHPSKEITDNSSITYEDAVMAVQILKKLLNHIYSK